MRNFIMNNKINGQNVMQAADGNYYVFTKGAGKRNAQIAEAMQAIDEKFIESNQELDDKWSAEDEFNQLITDNLDNVIKVEFNQTTSKYQIDAEWIEQWLHDYDPDLKLTETPYDEIYDMQEVWNLI